MIYVHVPFCRSFCRYCDFYSEIACKGKDDKLQEYTDCLIAEASDRREEILTTLGVNTLYIGGGTPSVMPLSFFSSLLEALPVKQFDEFTVEVNPDDIVTRGAEFLEGLCSLGVNRISMGVQSFDDGMLRWMRRRHDSASAVRAFEMIREAGFDNVSLDLIFGVRGMDEKMLRSSLSKMLELRPEHISAYQLSVEEGSELGDMFERGEYDDLPQSECRSQYAIVCDTLRAAGYIHYEISNWALPGKQALHNSAYWTRAPYVGLGPGAHSLQVEPQQLRISNSQTPAGWTQSIETLSLKEIREEQLMLGLRRMGGVDFEGKHLAIKEKDWLEVDILSDLVNENC